ncbi:hypothetical protein ALQ26_101843 [Pseudomonas amygdali pv. lachrymans]|nr:hypothetical protein ALQ26_101843 [Pseudomonas amygdali pv. lachrymans]
MRNLEGVADRVNGGCGIEAPFRGRVLLIANVCTAHAKVFQDVEWLGYQAQKMTDRAGNCPVSPPVPRDVPFCLKGPDGRLPISPLPGR